MVKIKKLIAASVLTLTVATACGTTAPANVNATSYDIFHIEPVGQTQGGK